jgi:hypothetical protein
MRLTATRRCGTELNVVQKGTSEVMPAEAGYLERQESQLLLSQLVEAEFPDQ